MDTRLDGLPPLFDRRGQWLGFDADTLATLLPQTRELYDRLADAVTNVLQPREAAKQAAQERVHAIVAEIGEVEAAKPKAMTQTQLAKQWIASQRASHEHRA